MSKKKSLGHNPLAYSTRSHASFDFIAPSGEEKEEDQEKAKIEKETASYYLESSVVKRIKALANEKGTSYSAVVNTILRTHFQKGK